MLLKQVYGNGNVNNTLVCMVYNFRLDLLKSLSSIFLANKTCYFLVYYFLENIVFLAAKNMLSPHVFCWNSSYVSL